VKTAAALVLLLLLTACADAEGEAPTAAPTTVAASPTPTRDVRPTPEEIVADPEARLQSVKVRRTPTGLHVAAWWRVDNGDATGEGGAIVESSDDFETTHHRPWTKAWYAAPPTPLDVPGLEGLMQQPTTSFAPGVRAVSGGGDGATLFPFEAMARSTDGGASWTSYEVPKVDDERAYSSGEVVLPDGQVLALLTNWSDDRRNRPSDRHHGFYESHGDDWSHYSPVTPTFRPALPPTPRGWSPLTALQASATGGGVIWTTTDDERVYVSVDAGQTFRETRVR
jgi:hypothetical protein